MKYKECFNYIRSDYYRVTGRRNDSLLRMWIYDRLNLGLRFMFWHRLVNCSNILVGGGSKDRQKEYGREVSYRYTSNHKDWIWFPVVARRSGGYQCLYCDR